jgi:hypothetical protein
MQGGSDNKTSDGSGAQITNAGDCTAGTAVMHALQLQAAHIVVVPGCFLLL